MGSMDFESFALRIVDSFENLTSISPRTVESRAALTAREREEFVYEGFLESSKLLKIPAGKLEDIIQPFPITPAQAYPETTMSPHADYGQTL
jgi:hypothetical protein